MNLFLYSAIATFAVYVNMCSGENYIGEALIVVDDKALGTYVNEISGTASYATKRAQAVEKFKEDFNYIMSEVNTLFSTMQSYGLNFEIKFRAVEILNVSIFLSKDLKDGNQIFVGTSLQYFSDWLTSHNSFSTHNYDLALLFTGYDLTGDAGLNTAGMANIGTVCNSQKGIGVIEMNATYLTAVITAHEISHILGASHDGIASDRVMAINNYPKHKNRWSFSECTATYIKEFLSTLSPNCLRLSETSATSTKPTSSWTTYNGQLFNHDVVCQRGLNNSKSYTCMGYTFYNNTAPKGDVICQQLYCYQPDNALCYNKYPSEGMICDRNKRCDNGRCVPDSSAASDRVNPSCVLGDQKILMPQMFSFNGTCPQYVTEYGSGVCYYSLEKQLCCATCNTQLTGISGCEYGDKNRQCSTMSRSQACSSANVGVCCGTCRGYVGKRSADQDVIIEVLNLETKDDKFKNEGYKAEVPDDKVIQAT